MFEDRGELRIIPRALQHLDYTPGGADYDESAAAGDIGMSDEIHGESGDDFIYGQVGDDVLFGESQDDSIVGGYGHDWISGGTGSDGILGDDGRIYTSRNSAEYGEPLYGIDPLDSVNDLIQPNGPHDSTLINVDGQIRYTANLTPFQLGDSRYYNPQTADDIIYGGLGSDSIHGGAGDDAMSGAEALPGFYALPGNNGDALGFGTLDPEEFAAYNENNPMAKIEGFFLNFNTVEGSLTDTGIHTDGDDVLFGDLGNDWLVGGTGRDHLWGGFGSDLLNADDDHDSVEGNTAVDPDDPSYADRIFGGGGRDYMIANNGGDQMYDWLGEFNSYIIPMSPFGPQTVTRIPSPSVEQFLYDLSASDGADMTRAADSGTDAKRNGETDGEIGLVNTKDPEWQDQNGAPDDPQPGNKGGVNDDKQTDDTTSTETTDKKDKKDKDGAMKIAAAPELLSLEYEQIGVQSSSLLYYEPGEFYELSAENVGEARIDGFLLNVRFDDHASDNICYGDLASTQPHLFSHMNIHPSFDESDYTGYEATANMHDAIDDLYGWNVCDEVSENGRKIVDTAGFERLYKEEQDRRYIPWRNEELLEG
jgi:hypothetical protein